MSSFQSFCIIWHSPPIYLHLIFDILQLEIRINFDQLEFFPNLNWIFAGYIGSKNPVLSRTKFQFIKPEILNQIMSKLKCRQIVFLNRHESLAAQFNHTHCYFTRLNLRKMGPFQFCSFSRNYLAPKAKGIFDFL